MLAAGPFHNEAFRITQFARFGFGELANEPSLHFRKDLSSKFVASLVGVLISPSCVKTEDWGAVAVMADAQFCNYTTVEFRPRRISPVVHFRLLGSGAYPAEDVGAENLFDISPGADEPFRLRQLDESKPSPPLNWLL